MTKKEILEKHCNDWGTFLVLDSDYTSVIDGDAFPVLDAMEEWAEHQSLFFQVYLSRYKTEEYVRTQKMYKEVGGMVTHRGPSIKDIYKDFIELKTIASESMDGVIYSFHTGEETNNIAEIIKKRDK